MRFRSEADRTAARHFFRDRALAQSLFEQVAAYVETLGRTEVVATRSRVAFLLKTRFLWVHEATEEGIWLAFLLPRHVPSPRLRSGPMGRRWSHHLKVTGPMDAELKRWIDTAFRTDAADARPTARKLPAKKATSRRGEALASRRKKG